MSGAVQQEADSSTRSQDERVREIVRLTEESLRLHTIDAAEGLRVGNRALQSALLEGDTILLVRVYNALGSNHWILGDYDLAVREYLHALEMAEAVRSPFDIGRSLNNLGLVCRNIGMTERAESYLREAVRLRTRIGDRAGLTRSMVNFGLLLYETGRIDSAKLIHRTALILAREVGDSLNAARNLHYLGRIERALGKLPEARALIDQALRIFTDLGDRNGAALALVDRADVLMRLGNTAVANVVATNALEEAVTLESPFAIREASTVLSRTYAALGDYRLAYRYQGLGREMDDSLRIQQASYRLAQMSIEKELAEKERKWAFREEQRRLRFEAARRTDTIVRNALIAGTVLLGIIIIVLVAAFRSKQRSARMIAERNAHIAAANQELALEIETRERLLGIIGHDLLAPVGNIAGMLELASERGNGISVEDRAELIDAAMVSARNSAALLGRLLDWARAQKKDLHYSPTEGDLMQFARSAVEFVLPQANMKKLRLELSGPTRMMMSFDPHMITVILENLLSNAVKFTSENGRVDLEISTTADRCVIRVTDTGKGIRPDMLERIREGKSVGTERGSAMEAGHGLGLELCHRLVKLHGGRLDVTSKEGRGTTFTVELPCRMTQEKFVQ